MHIGQGGLLSSFVSRARPEKRTGIDQESAQMALELSSRAQLRARTDDATAIQTLLAQVRDLDEEIACLLEVSARDQSSIRNHLESTQARLHQTDDERRAQEAARTAEAGERLYLRNVLLRYMETEDHETMFPVLAMCLQFTADEVSAIARKRSERERRASSWRIFGR